MKAKAQPLFKKQEKRAYTTPQLAVYGSVAEITAQNIPAKQFGGSDGALWQQQSVGWAS